MYKSYSVDEAKRKMEYYCSYQERCHQEVLQKLKGLNMIPEACDVIIVHLLDNNFLNEERFACAFARGKFRVKNWGKNRIVNELKFRDISRFNIDRALKEITDEDYSSAFNELAEKQWETVREANILKKKRKIADFLLRKGFESSLVMEKMASLK